MNSNTSKMYQVSTLQALAMGYTKDVITVGELLEHGDTGLGTFRNVDGEMIMIDGHCYRALDDGSVAEADPGMGVPFSSVTRFQGQREFGIRRTVAYGIRIRNLLFFIGCIRRLCRTVRLEIRSGFDVDRTRKCVHRLAHGVGDPRAQDKGHDKSSRFRDDARILFEEVRKPFA